MEVGDIISYIQLCSEEHFNIQKGMNFRTINGYSIFLMSVRPNAPYADRVEDNGSILIYEGHDIPNYKYLTQSPKTLDQPQFQPNGKKLTDLFVFPFKKLFSPSVVYTHLRSFHENLPHTPQYRALPNHGIPKRTTQESSYRGFAL